MLHLMLHHLSVAYYFHIRRRHELLLILQVRFIAHFTGDY